MSNRVEELLERGVTALEKLADDEIEMRVETLPPVCPHCETINPNVQTEASQAQGRLAEFCLQAFCLHCHKTFFMVPIQSMSVKTKEELEQAIQERTQIGGYKRNGNDN